MIIPTKKRYRKWPSLKAAAKMFGCAYPHLRRVVSGKVSSPHLLAKYQALFSEDGEPLKTIPPRKRNTPHKSMNIIKANKSTEPPPLTLTEVFDLIAETAQKLGVEVSHHRQHAVESQLRGCIRRLGYRVRETEKAPASVVELAKQCQQAMALLNGSAPEKHEENIGLMALAVLSNLQWEIADNHSKDRELPEADLPTVPAPQP